MPDNLARLRAAGRRRVHAGRTSPAGLAEARRSGAASIRSSWSRNTYRTIDLQRRRHRQSRQAPIAPPIAGPTRTAMNTAMGERSTAFENTRGARTKFSNCW